MKAIVKDCDDNGHVYKALMFVCPGCQDPQELSDGTTYNPSGVHMLPFSGDAGSRAMWQWDGNLEEPTLTPSILSSNGPYSDTGKPLGICHSFLIGGVFQFLDDCTHSMAGQSVPMPDLPTWADESG